MATNPAATDSDSDSPRGENGKYHFLDVGAQPYGDCIVVEFGAVRVLIDGSHEKDFAGQKGYDSTPEQLQQVFGGQPPYHITLMVVTHCHQDHIGALPKLVSEGIIEPEWALLTDHRLGFGRTQDDADSVDLSSERTRTLAAALREEDASSMSDADLAEFIDAAATVESKYSAMLAELKRRRIKVIEYRGQSLPTDLIEALRPTNMTLLGPSLDQLVMAAEQIATTNKEASDSVQQALQSDATRSNVDLYRLIVGRDALGDAERANPRGNGMNCQSVTLAFGPPEARVLLAGDMQFAEPGVKGADGEVAKLRAAVKAAGPFRMFKTTHHTSHNGQNDDVLADLGDPEIIVHSGGSHDAKHPFPATLDILKRRSRRIVFARTDRNGLITVEPHLKARDAVTIAKGRLNDFTDNVDDAIETEVQHTEIAIASPDAQLRRNPRIVIVELPAGPIDMRVAGVEIVVRQLATPSKTVAVNRGTGDRPTISASRTPKLPAPRSSLDVRFASGRTLPRLLVVTDSERLAGNIGRAEAQAALAAVRTAGQTLCDVVSDSKPAVEQVQAMLRSDTSIAGVVIAGGYDVVPSAIVDPLSKEMRTAIGAAASADIDQFLIWSDEVYGDLDGDHIGERPVSRIPDGRDSTLFLTALQAKEVTPADRFGVRNVARPFADTIWSDISGARAVNISETFLYSDAVAGDTLSPMHYFMLHGSDADGTYFAGEYRERAGNPRAFSIKKVPQSFSGVVFSGCCWGALTVAQKALDAGSGTPAPRVAEQSIALAYLKAGANAFVGCTGSHYSGEATDPAVNYAAWLHEAFWKTLPELQFQASPTLFGARNYYGKLIAETASRSEPIHVARRLKNRAQFTCLGLGW